jgi:type II secretion system protein E
MSQEPYRTARKEMEILLKTEAGVNITDSRGKKLLQGLTKDLGQKPGGGPPGRGGPMSFPDPGKAIPAAAGGNEFLGGLMLPEMSLPAMADDPANAESMIRALTEKAGYAYQDFSQFDLTDEAKVKRLLSFIPSATARDRKIFPVDEIERPGRRPILKVAIFDPLNVTIIDDLRLMLPEHEIEVVVCAEEDIIDAIDRYYGVGEESIETMIEDLGEEEGKKEIATGQQQHEIDIDQLANSPPVIKLVNLLLMQAIQDNASDLHIEPFTSSLRIRYRVDGVLREIPSPPKSLQVGLISRLKVMAGLNISESRQPQDGRIRLSLSGREIDLRVACVPTVHGESMVMRILDKSSMMIGVSQLGVQQEILDDLLKIADRPNGIVLVTGPTGSGKTTTLYSILTEVFDPGSKFITTEDPVEYELPGIVQVNVNASVGLTFAACLRSILRQDPDVILVGEIRDVETASIAIQAALTGHMVFSTLHTNSAAATITRLVDMGIEPFLLTSTLQAIVGQRLVRTICERCRAPYIPTDEELSDFGVSRAEVADIVFSHGRGCDECNMSGYRGRIGIFEVLKISDQIRELILQRATSDELHALAVHEGMMTMRQDGWLKICYGVTTFEEVNRQTHPETEESIMAEREMVRRSLERIAAAQREREREDVGDEGGNQEFQAPTLHGGGH